MSKSGNSKHTMTEPHSAHSQPPMERLLLELAQAKLELEESRLRTEAMLDSLGEGLIVTDAHGIITTVNSYALSSLGVSESELLGSWFPRSIVAIDRQGRPLEQLNRPVVRAVASGEAVSEQLYYLRKDGASIPVFVTVAPVLLEGKPIGAVEVFRDLTDELRLEIAKDEFVSLASHQLRTPATGVMTILSMLTHGDFGPLSPLQQKYLRKAVDTNNYQLQIIEDLLNVARVDAGKMSLEIEPVDLGAVLRESVRDQAPITSVRHQTVRLQAPRQLTMPLDASKIRMVMNNLISNASKYSPVGSEITLRLDAEREAVVIAVIDQGVGVAEEDLPRLFTKFTRIENVLSQSVGGTGLGLFLAKNLVELHRGIIDVQSQPGKGSIFTVRLPLQEEGTL